MIQYAVFFDYRLLLSQYVFAYLMYETHTTFDLLIILYHDPIQFEPK